jgi:prepilin-type N-terminal cleavage/methylation domain-containing protein
MTALSICAPVLGASRAQAGFSMVEVSLALVVAGLMSWAAFSGYETVSAQQDIERGRAEALQLQSTLRAFALRNARLPCPDASSTGDGGYESQTAGVCSAGNQVGWFPYVSVGLERPVSMQLKWRCDTPARRPSSSWLTRRWRRKAVSGCMGEA